VIKRVRAGRHSGKVLGDWRRMRVSGNEMCGAATSLSNT